MTHRHSEWLDGLQESELMEWKDTCKVIDTMSTDLWVLIWYLFEATNQLNTQCNVFS